MESISGATITGHWAIVAADLTQSDSCLTLYRIRNRMCPRSVIHSLMEGCARLAT